MSSEIITSNDLKKILASAFPARANTTITEVTLPYTPPCNGILFGYLRASAQGRAYKHLYNATPDLWDFYQAAGGYSSFASFVEQNKVVSERAVANLQQQYYYFMPLDGTSPLFGGSADAVVEEGTKTCTGPVTWWWRKWESGIVDLWGESTASEAAYGAAVLSWYPHSRTLTFPFQIKDAAGSYSVYCGSGWGIPGAAFPYSHDSSPNFITQSNIYSLASSSGTLSVTYKIQLTARWK